MYILTPDLERQVSRDTKHRYTGMQTYLSLLDQNALKALPTPDRVSGKAQGIFIIGSLDAS